MPRTSDRWVIGAFVALLATVALLITMSPTASPEGRLIPACQERSMYPCIDGRTMWLSPDSWVII